MPEVTASASQGEGEKVATVNGTDNVTSTANGTAENGVSSTSPDKKSPEKSECDVLLAQGKRHLFVKDYPNAVATLGDVCAKLSETFGELADECADAYFCYGRALLELAREESNVLGTEPEKEDSEEGDEEEEEGEEVEKEEENKDGEAEAKPESDSKESGDNAANNKEEKDTLIDETIDTTKNEDGDEKDDVENLQLAWEVFELAKKIFERQKSDAKLAETYLYLGEIGLESENYIGAIEDMKRCVEIQKQILPADHRDIAETYFQLGVACSLCNEFDQGIENFKMSSNILESRIENLKKNEAPQGETEKSPFYSAEKEISEIQALLPEIKAKIVDMEDFKKETIKSMMASLKEQPQNSDGAGPSSMASGSSSGASVANGSTPKPATDISHLVRKKRKPEEDIPSVSAVKKSCTDEAGK